jgi:lipoprotein NlpI
MNLIVRYTLVTSAVIGMLLSGYARAEEKLKAPKATQQQQLEEYLTILNEEISDSPSRIHHRRAEVLFRLGRFKEAIADYDKGIAFGSPHDINSCWERGLAQYYRGDFRGGAEQFYRYHQVGALDIENGLWRLMCIAKYAGVDKARVDMLTYTDKKRPPFPALLDLFLDKGKVELVIQEATKTAKSQDQLTANLFYAHYYVGKYYEMIGENEKALSYIQAALKHNIAHFMYACAKEDVRRLKAWLKNN